MVCDILLESSRQGLQLRFRPYLNQRYVHKVTCLQSCGSPNFGNFGTLTWGPKTKCHLDAGPVANHRVYYKGEGGGFTQVRAAVNLMSLSLLMVRPNTKSAPTMH